MHYILVRIIAESSQGLLIKDRHNRDSRRLHISYSLNALRLFRVSILPTGHYAVPRLAGLCVCVGVGVGGCVGGCVGVWVGVWVGGHVWTGMCGRVCAHVQRAARV